MRENKTFQTVYDILIYLNTHSIYILSKQFEKSALDTWRIPTVVLTQAERTNRI